MKTKRKPRSRSKVAAKQMLGIRVSEPLFRAIADVAIGIPLLTSSRRLHDLKHFLTSH